MIGQRISHYKIIEKLGQGGMGEVYLADDTELKRRVALKFPASGIAGDREALMRFRREAQAAAALRHPNIITIHEVAEHEGRPYLVMEHVDGQSITAYARANSLSRDALLDLAIQVAEGVEEAHKAGVVHRDLKPQNILVDAAGRVTILDFGLAQLEGATQITKDASTLGTIQYMSPEQVDNGRTDHRSDLFSLGTVLYELFAQRLPFEGESMAAVMNAIVRDTPQPLSRFSNEITPALERIVSKALTKDPSERYQSAADLAADLRRVRRRSSVPEGERAPATPASRAFRARILVPASVVAALLTVILIVRPFRLEFASDQAAVSSQDLLAVMYFENLADAGDERRIGEIVTDLLINDLSESSGLSVVSSQRLYDLLKLEGREGLKRLDRDVSTSVARRAAARWMLLGKILRDEPSPIVTSQLVDVESGSVVASQRVDGGEGEDVFAIASRLGDQIREDMSLSAPAAGPKIRRASSALTHSAVAYRLYLEGLEHQNRYEIDEARASYLQAVEQDSTFALPYYRLSTLRSSPDQILQYIDTARRLSGSLPERERLQIEARYSALRGDNAAALTLLRQLVERYPDDKESHYDLGQIYRNKLGEVELAIQHLQRAVEIDPMYKTAYNQMAYAYSSLGDLDRSIWAINKYIDLAPDEHNPYDTRGDLYARNGNVEEAISSYRQALRIRPQAEQSKKKLGHMFRAKLDFESAEAIYRELLNSSQPETRSRARTDLAGLLAYQGKLREALEQYERGIAADRLEDADGGWAHWDKYLLMGQIEELRGDYEAALEAAGGLPPRDRELGESGADATRCEWLAKSGDLPAAQRVADQLRQLAERQDSLDDDETGYRFCQAMMAFAREDYDEAVTLLEWNSTAYPYRLEIWNRFPLARAYQAAGRLANAVEVYESILFRYDESWAEDPTTAAIMHYYAGLAYESSGWTDKAVERLRFFVKLWENADAGIAILEDARERLPRLEAEL